MCVTKFKYHWAELCANWKWSTVHCFASDKFHHYIYGFYIILQSDHKPIESIMKSLNLHQILPHLQRMLLKLQNHEITVQYTRCKDICMWPVNINDESSEEAEPAVHTLINSLSVSERWKTELRITSLTMCCNMFTNWQWTDDLRASVMYLKQLENSGGYVTNSVLMAYCL